MLFGSIGYAAESSGDLLDSDSLQSIGGPAISWDLFNYGRIKNRVRVQDAVFQELVVNYQNTVLEAAQEVEDAMVAFLRTQEEAKILAESVMAYKRSVDLSLLQYREASGGRATAHVCVGTVCRPPITDPGALGALLALEQPT